MKISYNLDEINSVAQQFIEHIGNNHVFAFNGVMGAGKTTMIKAICEQLGVEDIINSPTFAIVNEYRDRNNQPIYHFDCYRLKNIGEALNLGAEEYLYSGNLCFIEWAENIVDILPDDVVEVNIEVIDDKNRVISW